MSYSTNDPDTLGAWPPCTICLHMWDDSHQCVAEWARVPRLDSYTSERGSLWICRTISMIIPNFNYLLRCGRYDGQNPNFEQSESIYLRRWH